MPVSWTEVRLLLTIVPLRYALGPLIAVVGVTLVLAYAQAQADGLRTQIDQLWSDQAHLHEHRHEIEQACRTALVRAEANNRHTRSLEQRVIHLTDQINDLGHRVGVQRPVGP